MPFQFQMFHPEIESFWLEVLKVDEFNIRSFCYIQKHLVIRMVPRVNISSMSTSVPLRTCAAPKTSLILGRSQNSSISKEGDGHIELCLV